MPLRAKDAQRSTQAIPLGRSAGRKCALSICLLLPGHFALFPCVRAAIEQAQGSSTLEPSHKADCSQPLFAPSRPIQQNVPDDIRMTPCKFGKKAWRGEGTHCGATLP